MLGAAPFGSKEDLQDMVTRATQGDGFKRKITLLGSTGSIGTQTLDICEYLPVGSRTKNRAGDSFHLSRREHAQQKHAAMYALIGRFATK